MKKTLIIVVVSCVSMFALQAQENLKNEVIDVVKDFRPKVMQATKIKSQPVFIDTSKVSENLSYKIRFEEFRVQQQTDSLSALLLVRPDLNKLYTKHVELGLGSLLNPHLAVDMSNGRHTKQFYRLYFNYDGAYASALPTEDQFSHLRLGAAYKHIFDDFILQSDAHLNDLYRLYQFLLLNKRTTVFEFGSGWSTLMFSLALKELKDKFSKEVKQLRRNNPFELIVLENQFF